MNKPKSIRKELSSMSFGYIYNSFKIAIKPNKMSIAFLAVIIIATVGLIMDILNPTVSTCQEPEIMTSLMIPTYSSIPVTKVTELDVFITNPTLLNEFVNQNSCKEARQGVYSTAYRFLTARFTDSAISVFKFDFQRILFNIKICTKSLVWAITYHPAYSLVFFIITFVIIAISGGAICRVAALEIAQNEKAGPVEAIRFALSKLWSLLIAPFIPGLLVLLFGSLIYLGGLFSYIPNVGDIITALMVPIMLFCGFFITLIIIGAIGGIHLLLPTVAFENTESYGAISRAYNYTYSKPWHLSLYLLIAGAYGTLCYLFVRLFGYILLRTTHYFLSLSNTLDSTIQRIWPVPSFLDFLPSETFMVGTIEEKWAYIVIYISVLLVVTAVAAFVMSFYFSASTVIYTLIRKISDGTEPDTVYTKLAELEERTKNKRKLN